MNKRDTKNLTKSQLMKLLLKQSIEIEKLSSKIKKSSSKKAKNNYENNVIQPPLEFRDDHKPIPAPRKSVKQMVQEYEDNIIPPPFRIQG